jgi:hypothetical protein
MKLEDYINLVAENFGILFKKHGFEFTHVWKHQLLGDYSAVLQSKSCQIKVWMDKGWITISGSPLSASIHPEKDAESLWSRLDAIINFLNLETDQIEFAFKESGYAEITEVGHQMSQIAEILEPHWKKLINFFKEKNFKKHQRELKEFSRRLAEERFGKIKKN